MVFELVLTLKYEKAFLYGGSRSEIPDEENRMNKISDAKGSETHQGNTLEMWQLLCRRQHVMIKGQEVQTVG